MSDSRVDTAFEYDILTPEEAAALSDLKLKGVSEKDLYELATCMLRGLSATQADVFGDRVTALADFIFANYVTDKGVDISKAIKKAINNPLICQAEKNRKKNADMAFQPFNLQSCNNTCKAQFTACFVQAFSVCTALPISLWGLCLAAYLPVCAN